MAETSFTFDEAGFDKAAKWLDQQCEQPGKTITEIRYPAKRFAERLGIAVAPDGRAGEDGVGSPAHVFAPPLSAPLRHTKNNAPPDAGGASSSQFRVEISSAEYRK